MSEEGRTPMRRVTISELVRLTGLSRATIDRALHDRGGVHARTRQVIDAAVRELQAPAVPTDPAGAADSPEVDMVLRLGRGMMEQIKAARAAGSWDTLTIHDMHQKSNDEVLDIVRALCRDTRRGLVLTAKNAEPLRGVLVEARRRGKRVITLVSDLTHDARDAFIGIDNRMAGQTAAFLIGGQLGARSADAGVVLGDYAFSGHEDREIGFRSHLRANFPNVRIADVAKGEDSPERTYDAVRSLLAAYPHLRGLYNVAGGNAGLAAALRDSGRAGEIAVVTHEVNHITLPLIREGLVGFALSQNPFHLLSRIRDVVSGEGRPARQELFFVDFAVHTRFNLPGYATDLVAPERPAT